MQKSVGRLYLVGTPIGNLEDMSARAVRVLKEVDILLCEDTRRTLNLLRHFGIKRSVQSFHDHSSPQRLQAVCKNFYEGKTLGFVTDGGMPVISDPGFTLVRAAYECHAIVTAVPGPSAVDTLFAISGLCSPKFLFHGFFPRSRKEVEKALEQIKMLNVIHLFFEAPKRLMSTVEVLYRHLPNHEMFLGREMTKIHEEAFRGTIKEVFEALKSHHNIRGECTFAVRGGIVSQTAKENHMTVSAEQQAEITAYLKAGRSSRDTARELSKKFEISRRIIYGFIVQHLT